jgi:hypothetical protein
MENLNRDGEEGNYTIMKDRKKKRIRKPKVEGLLQSESDSDEGTFLQLIHRERVLCSRIKDDFIHMDANKLISLATRNQVVYL